MAKLGLFHLAVKPVVKKGHRSFICGMYKYAIASSSISVTLALYMKKPTYMYQRLKGSICVFLVHISAVLNLPRLPVVVDITAFILPERSI